MNRNLRRVKLQNIKKRNQQRYSFSQLSNSPEYIGIVSNTTKLCSCWMCGNSRKFFKQDTLKEKSQNELLKSENQ